MNKEISYPEIKSFVVVILSSKLSNLALMNSGMKI